jgi:hypothetical protein
MQTLSFVSTGFDAARMLYFPMASYIRHKQQLYSSIYYVELQNIYVMTDINFIVFDMFKFQMDDMSIEIPPSVYYT